MSSNHTESIRLHDELIECFKVIDSSLKSYYDGNSHMFRPLAGQLRILFCDTIGRKDNSLLGRIFPKFSLGSIKPIKWLNPENLSQESDIISSLLIKIPAGQDYIVAQEPFVITEFSNGLQIADIEIDESSFLIPLNEWLDQEVTIDPSALTVRSIIRTVADQGGGAHVDSNQCDELTWMKSTGPNGVGFNVLLIVAIARLAQKIGVNYYQSRNKSESLDSLKFFETDPDDKSVKSMARIPQELFSKKHNKYNMMIIKRIK